MEEFPVSKYEREPGVQPVQIARYRRANRGLLQSKRSIDVLKFTDSPTTSQPPTALPDFSLWLDD
jgi:hypothetical protein